MSQFETLRASDGHVFNAYLAKPAGTARGGVVIVQEIFGLSPFIRAVADSFAVEDYLTIAPALFDRIRRDIVLGSSPEEVQQAVGYRKQIKDAQAVLDISAAVAVARHAGKVAVIGYCWGGMLAWLTACQIPLNAAVSFYGVGIGQHLTKTPMCPMMLHVGGQDGATPPDEFERVRAAFPNGWYYVYPDAGHAFANSLRPNNYHAASAALAIQRTNEFLTRQIG